MTAVQSLPTLHSLPRLGWNSDSDSGFSTEDISRLASGRKPLQRSNSSSSQATISNASASGSSLKSENITAKDTTGTGSGKGFWTTSAADSQASILTPRLLNRAPLVPISSNAQDPVSRQSGPFIPTPKIMQNQNQIGTNGTRMGPQPTQQETPALLVLLPMNATFERKQINVPLFPEILRIGRQTNAKTVPTPANGYFDSKVLSRQHAEVWADRGGKVWIRDVKSSNGTFVNGVRLSPESRDSDPHELRENDMLELGIDIVSEDQKSIVHHKVSAKIEHAGVPTNATSVLDLNMSDIEPGSGGGLSLSNGNGSRRPSNASISTNGRSSAYQVNGTGQNGFGVQKHMGAWISPVSLEHVVKRVAGDMKTAKSQSTDLLRTEDFLATLGTAEAGQELPEIPLDLIRPPPIVNGFLSHKEHISPFSQAPAPPPQLPLPETPAVPPSSSPDGPILASLRRSEIEKISPINGKIDPTSSQILQLVDALSSAKKEIDHQDSRMRELEEELKRERKAREYAEERMRSHLENLHITNNNNNNNNNNKADTVDSSSIASEDTVLDTNRELSVETESVALSTARLQEKLDIMLHEMRELKEQLDHYKHRAETAEAEKSSLADMVEQIRAKDEARSTGQTLQRTRSREPAGDDWNHTNGMATPQRAIEKHDKSTNGSIDKSILQQKHLQELAAAAMSLQRDDRLMQSAPYASIVGVVLIGVGIMAYINGWQKLEGS